MPPGARIKWMFTTKKARAKMGHAYPRAAFRKDRQGSGDHNHVNLSSTGNVGKHCCI